MSGIDLASLGYQWPMPTTGLSGNDFSFMPTQSQQTPGGILPSGSNAGGFNFGFNPDTFKFGLQGLGTLGNLWGAFQANKLARDQLDFTKNITNTNLNNSIQSYNTSLADRARARGIAENQDQSQIDEYIARNRLSR